MESPYARDDAHLVSAYGALAISRPPIEHLVQALRQGGQFELDLTTEIA
jgi:hypothetical protein